MISFINKFRNGEVDYKKYDKLKINMEDAKYRTKVTETIIVFLDRSDNISKAKILADLIIAFSSLVNYLVSE